MSVVSDILAFARPTIATNTPISTIRRDLKSAQDAVFDKATVLPDDDESLVEDHESWVRQWDAVLVSFSHRSFLFRSADDPRRSPCASRSSELATTASSPS